MRTVTRTVVGTVVAGLLVTVGAVAASAAAPAPCSAGYVALSYDDGPSAFTARVSTALKANGLRATFFFLGENVGYRPTVVTQVVADGSEVGNHGYDHANLAQAADGEAWDQLNDTNRRDQRGHRVQPAAVPTAVRRDELGPVQELGLARTDPGAVVAGHQRLAGQDRRADQRRSGQSQGRRRDPHARREPGDGQRRTLVAKTLADKGLCAGKIPSGATAW